jgi:hypothetical protein
MKKLLSRITIALFVTLYACYPVHVMAEGRYQGIKSEDNYIWIVDTKTGKMRVCYTWANNLDTPPSCGPWSKDRK